VCNAVTNLTVDEAVKETGVPETAVAEIATDVPERIWLFDGTATVAGVAAVVALVTDATVTARGVAEEGATESPTIARAAAVAIEIFLNEFILVFLLVILVLNCQENS
jgi:ATP-dependent exoDNAse (exonuclease V) alpha subunit